MIHCVRKLRNVSIKNSIHHLFFQILEIDPKKKFDVKRTAIFTSVGFFYVAPMLYINYSKILPALVPASASYGALKKLLFDQSVFAGSMTVGFFMIMNGIEGNGV